MKQPQPRPSESTRLTSPAPPSPGACTSPSNSRRRGAGGWAPATADPVAQWLGPLLRSRSQADNLAKLAASTADQRHLFTRVPGFSTALFPVEYALTSLDVTAPDLPPEVTHCWVMSTMTGGLGWRWSPNGGLVQLLQTDVLTAQAPEARPLRVPKHRRATDGVANDT